MFVYLGSIQSLEDKELFAKAYSGLSAYRQQKIDRMKSDDDKRRSLGAGLLLKKALGTFGIDEKTLAFESDSNGKPYIQGYNNLSFNLSHSGDRVMCVICDRGNNITHDEALHSGLGCDVERIRKIDFKLADRFFHPEEIAQIKAQTDEQQKTDLFFKIWTMKESLIKANGLGLKMGLPSFSVFDYIDNADAPYKIYPLDFDDGYKYAVCSLGYSFSKNPCIEHIKDFHYI